MGLLSSAPLIILLRMVSSRLLDGVAYGTFGRVGRGLLVSGATNIVAGGIFMA